MFVATILVVLAGYPVAFTLAGTALAFGALGIGLGLFEPSLLTALAARYFGTMTNEILVAVPLFVFMGVMLERSKIAEQLLMTMGELFGAMRGGLGLSVILVGALLAASTGIVGATVVTMGLLSLPAMTRAGYDPKLASGAVCASGTLGQIIPPSTVLIFMGDILQGANQAAQLEMGNFSPEPLSVGQLFAGAMLPGLVLVTLYMLWIVFKAITDPESCPALELDPAQRATLPRRVFGALIPPLVLILAVLGSILTGVATPTESASVGAVGSMILAAFKGRLTSPVLKEVMRSTLMISSMVFVILLGASVFSLVFRGLGGDDLVFDILTSMPGGTAGAVFVVMLVIFFLGFFLDTFEIIFITVPIAAPVLIRLGVDPVWLGVLIGMNLQTSFLTPPFGFALFYLRGVADSAIKTLDIYKGALPFVGLQVAGIGLLWLVPELATWLPDVLFNNAGFALPTETINSIPIQATGVIDQFDNLLSDQPNGKVMTIDSFENLLPE
ncbi:MAG: TRAP transporter large permease subunit [Rhodospirillaceae bacterium]|nr:TRAP transporter large permease subunit [Rhodospirillaceae bacterium]